MSGILLASSSYIPSTQEQIVEYNQIQKLIPSDGTSNDLFGTSISSTSTLLALGSPGNNSNAGSVYLYQKETVGNYSVAFDGTGDYISTNSASGLTFGTGDFTIEFWVYPSTSENRGVFQLSTSTGGLFGAQSNTIALSIDNSTGNPWQLYWAGTFTRGSNALINQWSHVAIVRFNGFSKLYINGVESASIADTVNYTGSYLAIGGYYNTSYLFKGRISNFRVVKGTAIYKSNFLVPTTALGVVSSTSLLTCNQEVIVDTSSNNIVLIINGNASVDTQSPFTSGGPRIFNSLQKISASDSTVGDTFGTSVYNTDNLVVVGSPADDNTVTDVGSVYIFKYNGTTWAETQKITPSDGAQSDKFGQTVFCTDDTIIVGSTNDNTGSGSAYVYKLNGTTWTETQKLTAGDSNAGQGFGSSLSYYNNKIVVGSPLDNDKGTDSGSVYVYEYVQAAPLSYSVYFDGTGDSLRLPTNSGAFNFGTQDFTIECWVFPTGTLSGYKQIAGSAYSSTGGALYIFGTSISFYTTGNIALTPTGSISASTWQHIAAVRSNGTLKMYINGVQKSSAALVNNLTNNEGAIGARTSTTNSELFTGYISNLRVVKGAAVYNSDFTPPTSALTAITGTSLLTCRDTTIKDNSSNNFTVTATGNAAVSSVTPFTGTVSQWQQTQKIVLSDGAANDKFGNSVVLNELGLLVGAPGDDDKGSVLYYQELSPSSYTLAQKIVATEAESGDSFGYSIAQSNNTIAISSINDDEKGIDSGSVYVFENSKTFSISLTGVSDYLTVSTSNTDAFNFGTGDFTLEAWVYLTINDTEYRNVISLGYSSGETVMIRFSNSGFGNTMQFCTNANVVASCFLTSLTRPGIWLNAWNHVAMSRANGVVYCFANGNIQLTTTIVDSTPYLIRNSNENYSSCTSVSIGQAWAGNMSNIRITKGRGLYTGNFTAITSPLTPTNNTSLLIGQNLTIKDNSPNNFTITNLNGVQTSAVSPFQSLITYKNKLTANDGAAGDKFGTSLTISGATVLVGAPNTEGANTNVAPLSNSIYFDGTGDYLSVNYASNSTIAGDFTWETWVYDTGVRAYATLSAWRNSAGTTWSGWIIQRNNGANNLTVTINGTITINQISGVYSKNAWNHVALVRSGTTVTLYLNGVNSGTATVTGSFNPGTSYWVGSDPFNNISTVQLSGYISNQRFVNGTAVYTSNFTSPTSPLSAITGTALLICQSSTIVDSSTNNFTVTVSGNAAVNSATPFSAGLPLNVGSVYTFEK